MAERGAVRTVEADLAIVGGSLGGVAAALTALEAGRRVALSEATDWIGGQVTSQGVSALDEHEHIERAGATRRYRAFRERVRTHYVARGAPATMPDGVTPLDPGDGWVSRLCFEPRVGLAVLEATLAPWTESGALTLLLRHRPVAAEGDGARVERVILAGPGGVRVALAAPFFLDASDLGELLPLAGVPFVTGAESRADTGEPHAPDGPPRPGEIQAFTVPFAVEFRPGEDHTVPRPPGYAALSDRQPFALTLHEGTPNEASFRMFARGPNGELPFWSYRRIVDAALLASPEYPRDVALINWAGNDDRWGNLLADDPAERARAVAGGRRLSHAFLHWLQTEAPRDDGGRGYPELRLRPDVMGTRHGYAKAPYVRESRRIAPLRRVVEGDLCGDPAAWGAPGAARARPFADAVAIGWYPLDLHPSIGNADFTSYAPTRPYQLPLRALVPARGANVLPACKNLGVTHLANGATRLHPVEWGVGEAAAHLALACLDAGITPQRLAADGARVLEVQRRLLADGAPIAWTTDVPGDDGRFAAVQLLIAHGALVPGGARSGRLELTPDAPLTRAEAQALARAAARIARGDGPDREGGSDRKGGEDATASVATVDRGVPADAAAVREAADACGVACAPLPSRPTWGDAARALLRGADAAEG